MKCDIKYQPHKFTAVPTNPESHTHRKTPPATATRSPNVKYRGDKPRGFAVLTARPNPGRAVAGEFNSPRPSRDGSAGIDTRTPGASVRVGGSTPPDNSRRRPKIEDFRDHEGLRLSNDTTPKTWVLRGVAFPRNCRQLLDRVKLVASLVVVWRYEISRRRALVHN